MAERAPIALRAGPLTLNFEPALASIRYLELDGHEALRRVYAAVRDANWDTVEGVVRLTHQEIGADAFDLAFEVVHGQGDEHGSVPGHGGEQGSGTGEARFVWQGRLTGSADGTVRFSLDGRVLTTFRRNRIGFCVLHPAALAGRACELEHVDGSVEASRFPERIAPHQPFRELRVLRHEVTPGRTLEVRMEGDTFETEDQRNWTDASFKTYCTPLDEPFPVEVPAGTRVRQVVTIRALGEGAREPVTRAGDAATGAGDAGWAVNSDRVAPALPVVKVRIGDETVGRLPAIGLGLGDAVDAGPALDDGQVARLRAMGLAHLRVDLRLTADVALDDAAATLERAARVAGQVGSALEVALFMGDDADQRLGALRARLAGLAAPVARWLAFHADHKVTPAGLATLVRERLGDGAPVLVGTDHYFTELNRERPAVGEANGLSYSINPQVHATDDASLVETLAMQAVTLRSAAVFADGKPLVVSPVTLRPRSNPNATDEPPESRASTPAADRPDPRQDPRPDPRHDPRQDTPFCAAWTLGSVRYLAEGGARSVTYFEALGDGGVMPADASGEAGPRAADHAPRRRGVTDTSPVFPVYHVLAGLAPLAGAELVAAESSDPLAVEALALRHQGGTSLWLANLAGEGRTVSLSLPPALTGGAAKATPRTLDAWQVLRVELPPKPGGERT